MHIYATVASGSRPYSLSLTFIKMFECAHVFILRVFGFKGKFRDRVKKNKQQKKARKDMGIAALVVFIVVLVALAALGGREVGIEIGKESVFIPPPPPPEPKVFGYQQAAAAHNLIDTKGEAKKIAQFVTEVLGYENTVNEEIGARRAQYNKNAQAVQENIVKNQEAIECLRKEIQDDSEFIQQTTMRAEFELAIAEKFGK